MKIIIILVVTCLLFIQIKDFEFIEYDDPAYVYENLYVLQGLSVDSIKWAFSSNVVGNWHPITMISHMIDVSLYGIEYPGGHHVTSLILHLCNILLLYFLLKKIIDNENLILFVVLVFAIHPTRIESVVWVSERKDVLSAFFFLLSLVKYVTWVEKKEKKYFIMSWFFLAFGLMSKPMVITAPFVMLLLDYWPLKRIHGIIKKDNLKILKEKIPFFLLILIFSYITIKTQQEGIHFADDWSRKLQNIVVSYNRYLGMYFLPNDMSIYYPYPKSWSIEWVTGSVLILLVISYLAVYFVKVKPYVFVGWFWFLGMLVPVIGLIHVGSQSMAERYTYLPYIGLSIMVYVIYDNIQNYYKINKTISLLLLIVFLGNMVYQTQNYIPFWKNGMPLFTRVLAQQDQGYINAVLNDDNQRREVNRGLVTAYRILGSKYVTAGLYDKGIDVLNMALNVAYEEDYQTHKYLAVGYFFKENYEEAKIHIDKSIKLYGNSWMFVKERDKQILEEIKDAIDSKITKNENDI